MKKRPDHCVFRNNVLLCMHCNGTFTLKLPMDIDDLGKKPRNLFDCVRTVKRRKQMTDRDLIQQALDALKIADELCDGHGVDFKEYGLKVDKDIQRKYKKTITALRDRLAHCDRCGKKLGGEGDIHTCTPDPIGDAQDRLIAEMSAQPAQQELVGREAYMAIREARENASEDAYFAARPEHDKDLNRLMFRFGFYRGYPNTPPAAQPESVQPVSMYEDWYDPNSCSHCGMVGGHVKTCRHYTTPPAAAQPEQEPYGWVQPNPSFNSGIFNQGAECPSGWVGSAIAVHTAPPTAQQIDEAYAVGYSNGMTEGYEAGKAYAAAQRKPLTDEEIKAVIQSIDPDEKYLPKALRQFARAIEAAHGIKE